MASRTRPVLAPARSGLDSLGIVFGGIAVNRNLLCLAHADVRGKVFLVDLGEKRLVSFWEYGPQDGYADAGGVAMADDCAIYIADTRNDVVRCFSPFGKELGHLGRPPERPVGAARRDRVGVLDRPRGVAIAGDVVLVACGERKLVRGVQRFMRDGGALAPLRSFGDPEGRFGAPRGIAVSPSEILVADTLHGAVQRFTQQGRFIGHFSTARQVGESSRPVACVALPGGDLLVADAGDWRGLRRFGPGGEPRPELGVAGRFDEPSGLVADDQGRVYVLDRDGERVQRLTPELELEGDIVDLREVLHGR